MSDISIERTGRIAVVRFDRGTKANPLSLSLMRDLTEVARSFDGDHDLSAVVLAGGAENFCLGFDLKDAETARLRDAGLAERREALKTGGRMCRAWAEVEALTISAIDGWCVGGGVALAVSTDLRVAARGAQFYVPEIERGMNMSWGSVPRIANLTGPAKAKRLVALAEKIDAARAVEWGLADEVADHAMAAALAFATRAAAMPPVALRMCKRAVDAYAGALADTASWADADQFALAQTGEDYAEGVASFVEGRPPKFTGR
ncbi:MAG: enoyl-CoA hydratase/isomerase family protein [Pseudomonadota bacterium]